MKRAVYYARVSTSLQEEKGTIESQKTELINQIKSDGNILVKEYIDNGWSGGRIDRPALDRLRDDMKTDEFDVVYFLDTDRIARNVTYQNIIISELLKYEKEIIIKGKSYIDNPENKFTLTVLGAVNELEKTKIVERLMRGRREKARQGNIMGGGKLFGYSYVKKTDARGGRYVINDTDGDVVRLIFETYVNTDKSITGLVRFLEEKKIKTSGGDTAWARSSIKRILDNTSYYGMHYCNKEERIENYNRSDKYVQNTKTKTRVRDESEWILIKIPAIIEKSLFDRAQNKLKRNCKLYRTTVGNYLLSGLVKCGECNHTYTGVHWNKKKYYRCNYREKIRQHLPEAVSNAVKCKNKAVKGNMLEDLILKTVEDKVLQPSIIKKHIDILKGKKKGSIAIIKEEAASLGNKIEVIEHKKRRILDLYADSTLGKDEYREKIEELELKTVEIKEKRDELNGKLFLLQDKPRIERDVDYFCRLAKKKFLELDLSKKKMFLQQIIEQITFMGNKIVIRGYISALASNTYKEDNLPMHCSRHSSVMNNTEVIRFKIMVNIDKKC